MLQEQVHVSKKDGPPPILAGAEESDQPERVVAVLECRPVWSRYENLTSYLNIFLPLMLHELWSSLSYEYLQASRHLKWNVLIKGSLDEDDQAVDPDFILLQCALVMDKEEEAPKPNELVVFHLPQHGKDELRPIFGFIESSRPYRVDRNSQLDQRLTFKGKPRAAADVVVRVRRSYIINKRSKSKYFNSIFSMERVASLSPFLTQLKVMAQMGDPLTDMMRIILNPTPQDFRTIYYSTHLDLLDVDQAKAMFSIAHTMLMLNKKSVALINGPPGIINQTGPPCLFYSLLIFLGLRNGENSFAHVYDSSHCVKYLC